ncbi:MAG: IS200/IS605 family transposase [Balneolaceae bacterium]
MANSYNQTYVHFVFSTKNRNPLIKPEFEKRLWAYIAGIGKQNGFHIITSGGMPDHAHILLELSKTMTIAETIQKIKGVSSKWINDKFYPNREFSWQKGYGAFSIGQSGLKNAIRYIQNQKKHHESKTFKKELKELLNIYNIDYDEKYL